MKAKRAKQYRKLMHQYGLHFGFREPYQVLLDAEIIKDAARFKMKLGSMLENTLHGQIKPMITQCCIRHLYNLPAPTTQEQAEKDNWIAAAKAAERRRCGHHDLEEPLSTVECLESVVDPKGSGRNKHRYVVVSQDQEVRKKMRTIAGVPLVYINRSVMILEPMAVATEDVRSREEELKMRSGLKSRRTSTGAGVKQKRDDGEDNADAEAEPAPQAERESKKRKIKGPKEPNPLSAKKSKKSKAHNTSTSGGDNQAARIPVPAVVKSSKLTSLDTNSDPVSGPTTNESKKRKRKRKPKEINEDATTPVVD